MLVVNRLFKIPDDLKANIKNAAGDNINQVSVDKLLSQNLAAIYQVCFGGAILGYTIVKIDIAFDDSRELVIIYTAAITRWFSRDCFKVYDYLARLLSCNCVRIHSTEKAIDRAIEKSGYKKSETVYKKYI